MNGRLPLEDSSDWPQTWPKRVSDDPRHFIFRRPKFIWEIVFFERFDVDFHILEELLGIFEHHWQIPRRKSLRYLDVNVYPLSKGRTELQISLYGAKNDEEAAGDVRFCVAPQKTGENTEKPIFFFF